MAFNPEELDSAEDSLIDDNEENINGTLAFANESSQPSTATGSLVYLKIYKCLDF